MNTKGKFIEFASSTPVIVLCRLVLGGMFIYASLDKILHPHEFAKIIYNYQLFPNITIYLSAALVPWFEMVMGLALVIGIFPRTAAILLSSLLVFFIIILTINVIRGLDFNCGCFTTAATGKSEPVGLIFRDILLLIPGLLVSIFYKKKNIEAVAAVKS